jgi:hypothetical protein
MLVPLEASSSPRRHLAQHQRTSFGGLPVKKIALTLIAAASLGLTACGGGAETNNAASTDMNTEMTANEATADVNEATNDTGNALDAAGNALENAGNAVDNGAEAAGNSIGNATTAVDNASVNVTTNAQ